MRTEVRFLLAIALMLVVLVGTNLLFPPVQEPPAVAADSVAMQADTGARPSSDSVTGGLPATGAPQTQPAPGQASSDQAPAADVEPQAADSVAPERQILVEGPLYRYTFSSHGAELVSAELVRFKSLRQGDGPVRLLPDGTAALGKRLVVGPDTLELRDLPFRVSPQDGLRLNQGGDPQELTFTWSQPGTDVSVELAYTFDPDDYVVHVSADVSGVERPLLVTDLGEGMAFNEADSAQEVRSMAYVGNHVSEGINATPLTKVDEAEVQNGPFRWVAFKSKYFVMAILPGTGQGDQEDYLGGILVSPVPGENHAHVAVTQSVSPDGLFHYRLYMGPQEYARLQSMGTDLEEVNPYGWKFMRPVVRPIVGVILWILNFLHDNLKLGYGWVLVVFGVLMRVILWPLNQKAMRAQMRNMAVQPLVKEIQTKYKDNPERMQKEMMRLYKEYGFNPLAGCLPMLLPWPVLIALFFVFQNTIELRGVPFYWLPDLSAKDPLFILPVFLALSMFSLQWISMKSMPQSNPQMKMMMWFMPLFFGFIFMQFPSGLNLYYATANIATIPQQLLIARERKRVAARGPVKLSENKD